MFHRKKCLSELQKISTDLLAKRDHLRNELVDLTSKLEKTKVAKDTALKGKVRAKATTEELKRVFEIDKSILEKAKKKAEENLVTNMTMYNKNFKFGPQWQDSCSY